MFYYYYYYAVSFVSLLLLQQQTMLLLTEHKFSFFSIYFSSVLFMHEIKEEQLMHCFNKSAHE